MIAAKFGLAVDAFGWLDTLRALEVVEDALLARNVLHLLVMDVVYLDNVICHICVVIVLVCHDALRVIVVSVDVCDHGSIVLDVVVVLSDVRLHCAEVLVDVLDDGRLGDLIVSGLAAWQHRLSIAGVVDWNAARVILWHHGGS